MRIDDVCHLSLSVAVLLSLTLSVDVLCIKLKRLYREGYDAISFYKDIDIAHALTIRYLVRFLSFLVLEKKVKS